MRRSRGCDRRDRDKEYDCYRDSYKDSCDKGKDYYDGYQEGYASCKEREEKKKGPCDPVKSELFCISDVGATRFEGENDELVIFQDVAELKICAENCSQVLHTVSGNIHVTFEGSDNIAAVADFLFRIINETGDVVCERRIRFAAELPEGEDTEILFPFSFQCCDEVRSCDPQQRYRLQADLLDERLAENNDVFVQDITWSAIVFEPRRRENYFS